MKRLNLLIPMMMALLSCPPFVLAEGFGINATRLIYPQGSSSIAVTVRNTHTSLPYLVQASVSQSASSRETSPFTATPPIFRLEPNSVNQVRITGDSRALPTDRESVFYFHAMAVPAANKPSASQQSSGVEGKVQFGVGNIIKLFYRPAGLPTSSAMAQKNLQFTSTHNGLQISNPSPYFVSFASLKFAGQALKLETPAALMIAPFGTHTYPTTTKNGNVEWKTINDQGGIDAFQHRLP